MRTCAGGWSADCRSGDRRPASRQELPQGQRRRVPGPGQPHYIVRTHFLEQGMEMGPVVAVFEMAELMQHDIVAQGLGKAHQVEIQVDVAPGRTASPVRGIVLDGDFPVGEAEPVRKEGHLLREDQPGFLTQYIHKYLTQEAVQAGAPLFRQATRVHHLFPEKGPFKGKPRPSSLPDVFNRRNRHGYRDLPSAAFPKAMPGRSPFIPSHEHYF